MAVKQTLIFMRKLIFLLALLALPMLSLAQNDVPEPVRNRIYQLLDDFKKYGALSEDGETISTEFVVKFRELFKPDMLIKNIIKTDLTAPNSLKINEFIELYKNEFPNGLGIAFDNASFKWTKEKNIFIPGKENTMISVEGNVLVTGLNKDGKLLTINSPIVFVFFYSEKKIVNNMNSILLSIPDDEFYRLINIRGFNIGVNSEIGLIKQSDYNSYAYRSWSSIGFNLNYNFNTKWLINLELKETFFEYNYLNTSGYIQMNINAAYHLFNRHLYFKSGISNTLLPNEHKYLTSNLGIGSTLNLSKRIDLAAEFSMKGLYSYPELNRLSYDVGFNNTLIYAAQVFINYKIW